MTKSFLLFLIWAATQTYADFDVQIRAVTGRRSQTRADFDRAADTIVVVISVQPHGAGAPSDWKQWRS